MVTVFHPEVSEWDVLCKRPGAESAGETDARVLGILEDVRQNGDDALRRLTHEIDGVELESEENGQ